MPTTSSGCETVRVGRGAGAVRPRSRSAKFLCSVEAIGIEKAKGNSRCEHLLESSYVNSSA